VNKQRLVPLTA